MNKPENIKEMFYFIILPDPLPQTEKNCPANSFDYSF
jgi:hypothetical protein